MARDKYHFQVREALEKDGWKITHDPFRLKIGRKEIFIDLGAERLLAAEKGDEQIAVEVKSFPHASFLADFYEAVGKFITYEDALNLREPDRRLFLAIPEHVFLDEMENEELIQKVIQHRGVHFFVFNVQEKIIVKWIK